MAKKTLQQLKDEETKLNDRLTELAAEKKAAATGELKPKLDAVTDALTAYFEAAAEVGPDSLVEGLDNAFKLYNSYAKENGGKVFYKTSDTERATTPRKSGGNRKTQLRITDETKTKLNDLVFRAVKAHKDGVSKSDLILQVEKAGLTLQTDDKAGQYNDAHLGQALKALKDDGKISTTGATVNTKYHVVS